MRRFRRGLALCASVGGLSAAVTAAIIRDVDPVQPPQTLRRIAKATWGRDTPEHPTYFDTFAAPATTIVRDELPGCGGKQTSVSNELQRKDGSALAKAFFQSAGFVPEKMLWHVAGRVVDICSILGYNREDYAADMPRTFDVAGQRFQWWRLVESNEHEAVFYSRLGGLLYIGRSCDGGRLMVGTAMAPEGVRDEIWGSIVADPHSIALALMHRTYSRLLAKTTTLRAVMAE